MKKFFYFSLLCFALFGCNNTAIMSPDKHLALAFRLTQDGKPEYSILRDDTLLLDWSALGFNTEQADLTQGFKITGWNKQGHFSQWETVWGEERMITDNHREMSINLLHTSGIQMTIVFRLFDDGFAFRYVFPAQSQHNLTVLDETTEYRFAQTAEAWSIPWRTEYYEGLWEKRTISNHQSPIPNQPITEDTLCSPVTVEFADGSFGFVHEADLTDFPAQNLYVRAGALRTFLTPWINHQPPITNYQSPKAYIHTPFSSPWRLVVLTKTLPELVASRIMLNLNEPCTMENTDWIKPMKFIGIWWGMHIKTMTWEQGPKHGATTENMERYLRFAKEHGIQAVLAEGWNKGWEDWKHFEFTVPYDDWNMEYLSCLADSLGVQIVGHNETGGNAADYENNLDSIYRYHADHGIHVIKTGYVAPVISTIDGLQWNKGQSGVRHYRKVIETAAKYHISIDNHEPVMPTGLQRTYPNLMTQEGVRGQEWNAWSADGGSPCEHVTVLPFTRLMAGPVDYTPGVFHFENPGYALDPTGKKGAAENGITPRVHSTLMNQLGLFVCLYSPLQMACDLPEHYMEHPDAFQFIENVPCDWERSLLIDGKIGDFCIFARQERGTDNWFIGGITDEQTREAVVPLNFLNHNSLTENRNMTETYSLTLYRDADNAEWKNNPYDYIIEKKEVSANDTLFIRMAPGGGFAAQLTPLIP